MRTRFLFIALLITLLVCACNASPLPSTEQNVPTAPASQPEPVEPAQDATPEVETALPNCLGGTVSPIGQSIAEEYESVSYDQVLTWFCNGAEFEDILVALETESQTGTPAEEMLQMLADGFSWEEIWQIIELTE
jgi:hypothetical protein